ncbi:formiminoglutamate deiminase [Haloactinopolyspora alba]|uniref:Formiminoglutamate deiminase n=1 Tax=Haloactinopolyspora alba TaxID=648780 RepID=A0A2P8EFL1_9ACTN|nr:formimidoylglutamate deiminase [Haloactinopolyspora alba]PSL08241.1 formiminoglutamate deiminase [Haloactinopolyspora alba]
MTTYWAEHAWLDDAPAARVRIGVGGGVITTVTSGVDPEADDVRLPGLVLPGFADAHSHAFHRALRGRTHRGRGSFWSWREGMYELAGRLTPESYHQLARAVYAEMALAGVTVVGEFHYLHHGPGGARYDDPNAMGEALRAAADDAGVRLTLLDTCYLEGGIGRELTGAQQRFGDGSAQAWADRVTRLREGPGFRVGAAVHSVRAVPPQAIGTVAAWAHERRAPLHVHLSEQPAENEHCRAAYGVSPTELLADAGALGPRSTAVHANHPGPGDVGLLGSTRTSICACPTTEQDLADGLSPAAALRAAGSPLCLGSDQHTVVDLLGEARLLEMHERLAGGERGVFDPSELVAALTRHGHAALGWAGDGRIAVGASADLVAVRTDTVRTAGAEPAQLVLAATAADVDTVVSGGRVVVRDGHHHLGDIAHLLTATIPPAAGK